VPADQVSTLGLPAQSYPGPPLLIPTRLPLAFWLRDLAEVITPVVTEVGPLRPSPPLSRFTFFFHFDAVYIGMMTFRFSSRLLKRVRIWGSVFNRSFPPPCCGFFFFFFHFSCRILGLRRVLLTRTRCLRPGPCLRSYLSLSLAPPPCRC